MKKRSRALLVLLAGVCPVMACQPHSEAAAPHRLSSPVIQAPAPPDIPDTPAGRRLSWLLEVLQTDASQVTDETLTQTFSAAFLQTVPPQGLRIALAEMAARRPEFEGFEGAASPSALTAVLRDTDGLYLRLQLVTDRNESERISGLLLTPAGDLDPALDTENELMSALTAFEGQVNYLEADITQGSCTPVRALNGERSQPLGSTFKLYVLAALAKDVSDGKQDWETPLAIRDEWKSLPSGMMQNLAAGTVVPLRQYAQEMIRISDNTATDHLLHTLGRERVEATLAEMGHAHPEETLPFYSTRELFSLKLMLTPEEQQSYIAADLATRRALLAGYASRDPHQWKGSNWEHPLHVDTLEWFASPADLCRLLVKLRAFAQSPPTSEVSQILARNPGGPPAPETFDYVGFKGGSEPGVVNATWLVRRKADGAWRVVTLGFMGTEKAVDSYRAMYLAQAARHLSGR